MRTYIIVGRSSLKLDVATFFLIRKGPYFLKSSFGLGLFKINFVKKGRRSLPLEESVPRLFRRRSILLSSELVLGSGIYRSSILFVRV